MTHLTTDRAMCIMHTNLYNVGAPGVVLELLLLLEEENREEVTG